MNGRRCVPYYPPTEASQVEVLRLLCYGLWRHFDIVFTGCQYKRSRCLPRITMYMPEASPPHLPASAGKGSLSSCNSCREAALSGGVEVTIRL